MITCTTPDQILEHIDIKEMMIPFIVILSSKINVLTNKYIDIFLFCFEMSKFKRYIKILYTPFDSIDIYDIIIHCMLISLHLVNLFSLKI